MRIISEPRDDIYAMDTNYQLRKVIGWAYNESSDITEDHLYTPPGTPPLLCPVILTNSGPEIVTIDTEYHRGIIPESNFIVRVD